MQHSFLTSSHRIEDPRLARIFADTLKRRLLLFCAGQERTVSDIAQSFGKPLKQVHYHVTRLHRLGLLEIAREENRPGRAIKHYRAIARAFFLPSLLLESPNERLAHALREKLSNSENARSLGTLFFTDDLGRPSMEVVLSEEVEDDHAFELWAQIALTRPQVRKLRTELLALAEEARENAPASEKTYYFHAAIAPVD